MGTIDPSYATCVGQETRHDWVRESLCLCEKSGRGPDPAKVYTMGEPAETSGRELG